MPFTASDTEEHALLLLLDVSGVVLLLLDEVAVMRNDGGVTMNVVSSLNERWRSEFVIEEIVLVSVIQFVLSYCEELLIFIYYLSIVLLL